MNTDTPKVDALCAARGEPLSGLVWANDVRPLERENNELRRFKAAALTLTTLESVNLAMSKEKT